MTNEISGDLILDSLGTGIPAMTNVKAAMLKEACIWCLSKCEHENGVIISCLISDDSICYSIKWNMDIDIESVFRAYNLDDAVEYGAEAISLLLIRERTKFTAIRRAARPSGIDYWLGYKNKDASTLFSMDDARLEISGILKENKSNTVEKRVNSKLMQATASARIFPVFVSIIEFSHPKAKMVQKNAID